MKQLICPDCGHVGEEITCPLCFSKMVDLNVSDDEFYNESTYSPADLKKVEGEEVEVLDEDQLSGIKKTPADRILDEDMI